MALSTHKANIYSVTQVAEALQVSTETVRRKIMAGELKAIELGGGKRKQYRILARDLAAWLGEDSAAAIFGYTAGLDALRTLFSDLNEDERTELVREAQNWAREQRAQPQLSGRTPSKDDIKTRFS